MDEMKTFHFGNEFVDLTIRTFNPKSNDWTVYWADTMCPELTSRRQQSLSMA